MHKGLRLDNHGNDSRYLFVHGEGADDASVTDDLLGHSKGINPWIIMRKGAISVTRSRPQGAADAPSAIQSQSIPSVASVGYLEPWLVMHPRPSVTHRRISISMAFVDDDAWYDATTAVSGKTNCAQPRPPFVVG
jgi:hypothetical protein